MKIYTKTGDTGQTSLVGGQRRDKNDPRFECIGNIDELNATLGIVISLIKERSGKNINSGIQIIVDQLTVIQHQLFDLGSELATPNRQSIKALKIPIMTEEKISALEQIIDLADKKLSPLTNFVLPGGSLIASHLHLSRTVCRRAERATITLSKIEKINPLTIAYLNRLSDLLFIFARLANSYDNYEEIIWRSQSEDVII